jgi:two-component system, chemotaxis family, protein-glutamate methylesterase/glutaminase
MSNVRILIVDDMPLLRHVIGELFADETGYEVVGIAENGREALTRIHLLKPDLVILDIEMPVMDGWETLQAIQLSYPEMAVIVFSSLSPNDGDGPARALALGARAFVPKPVHIESRESAWEHLRENLLTKVKLHVEQK